MMLKRCFMFGHRDATDAIMPELIRAITRCIVEEQVGEFIVGSYGGFDHLAAGAAAEVKKQHPHVRLVLLQPYHPTARKVPLPQGFDEGWYPDGMETVPLRLAIVRANRRAIDCADCVIAYVWQTASNARNELEYAQKRRIPITLIQRPETVKQSPQWDS